MTQTTAEKAKIFVPKGTLKQVDILKYHATCDSRLMDKVERVYLFQNAEKLAKAYEVDLIVASRIYKTHKRRAKFAIEKGAKVYYIHSADEIKRLEEV